MDPDPELSSRLRAREPAAVDELLERDHSVAVFFARVLGGDGGAELAVAGAWQDLVRAVAEGTVCDGLRSHLLRRVAAHTESLPATGGAGAPLGTFNGPGDPWEGWWNQEPLPWPSGAAPTPEHVVRALRRLPLAERQALVLRQVAGLPAVAVADILQDGSRVETLLERARDAYLIEVDREMGPRAGG